MNNKESSKWYEYLFAFWIFINAVLPITFMMLMGYEVSIELKEKK